LPTEVVDGSHGGASASQRVLIVASRFNEGVTRRLVEGARAALAESGIADDRVDLVWVPGAFELPLVVHRGLATGRYRLAVALGAVIRGETPHFEYVAGAASRGLADAATRFGIPIGFGVLTCDTLAQALARAGGEAGNKGEEAARAAVDTLHAVESFESRAPA
jgi:6,7-dimethyl-8-ribityllumazine synthase